MSHTNGPMTYFQCDTIDILLVNTETEKSVQFKIDKEMGELILELFETVPSWGDQHIKAGKVGTSTYFTVRSDNVTSDEDY